MEAIAPEPVALTDGEADLFSKVNFHVGDRRPVGDLRAATIASGEAAARLMESLLERDAIPHVRLRFFTDPEFNIGTKRSRLEVFENHGLHDSAVFEHPHFAAYLKYFVEGPDLSRATMLEFCRIINEEILTSGMLFTRLQKFVRAEVRRLRLDPSEAGDEFYKLALEIGYNESYARSMRSAAKSVRR
jgi:hypothetical protein